MSSTIVSKNSQSIFVGIFYFIYLGPNKIITFIIIAAVYSDRFRLSTSRDHISNYIEAG